ncbi:MAG: hypothetical protein H6719_28030 [Sandaracinaceae bacterium]|nr:hypothetical protein [Sandaracinaceae bacterium]
MITTAVWLVVVFGAGASVAALGLRAGFALPWIERLHPRTRARWLAWSSLAPVAVGALLLFATFVPHAWLGLPDQCSTHAGHLHLCLSCGLPTPPLALAIVALGYAGWVASRIGRVLAQLVQARRALRRLRATEARDGELGILPIDGPVAFVAGFLQPRVFLSSTARSRAWSAVVAHERDHARHRDPLARLLARLASSVAPPGIGPWLEGRLVRAQELAADEAAADEVGDRFEVARQVVAWARQQRAVPPLALSFGHGDVTERVRVLIDAPRYLRGPSRAQLGALVLASPLLVAVIAPSMHHVIDELVHFLDH